MGTVRLTVEQLSYISKITGIEDSQEAVQYFAKLMLKENIDPIKLSTYIAKMMKKDKGISNE